MSWDAYVDSLKQRGMVHGAICGLDGSWFVASDGSKVRNFWFSLNGRVNYKDVRKITKLFDFSLTLNLNDIRNLDIIKGHTDISWLNSISSYDWQNLSFELTYSKCFCYNHFCFIILLIFLLDHSRWIENNPQQLW